MSDRAPTILRVPLLNANEDELLVAAVHVAEGEEVKAGQLLVSLESTKAASEIEAPVAGFVRRLSVKEDERVHVGALICLLTEAADSPLPEPDANDRAADGDVRATRKARELAEAHGVDLAALGVDGIIKERDVQALLKRGVQAVSPPSIEVELGGTEGEVVIWGAGGHARVLIDLVRESRDDLTIIGALDDSTDPATDVLGVPVIGSSARLPELRDRGLSLALLGIGAVTRNATRRALYERLIEAGYRVPTLIHRRACVEPSARIREGAQIFPGGIVGSNAHIGVNAIVNSGVVVSHDCHIGDHAHLTPGAILAGNVRVGETTVIGMGVTIYLGVAIGSDCVISNGVHVVRDVPDGSLVRMSD